MLRELPDLDHVLIGEWLFSRDAAVRRHEQALSSLSRVKHRWALTGTPLINSMADLAGLLAFLQCPVLTAGGPWLASFRSADNRQVFSLDALPWRCGGPDGIPVAEIGSE